MKIIAEIGVNHNGSIELAKKLVLSAKKSGADIVKFQTFKAKDNISKYAELADYQKKNSKDPNSQLELVEPLELSNKEFIEIYNYCKKINISFLSTAFDLKALKFLDKFNMSFIKIPSGEITNLSLLESIGKRNKKILLSTGMSNEEEVEKAINLLNKSGQSKDKITVLQCTSQYPASDNSINLKAMITMGKKFDVKFGLSDHSLGIAAPIAAAALGATVIEKHITLDNDMEGPDHKASMEIIPFKEMVSEVKRVNSLLGSGKKEIHKSERQTRLVARKSLVASRNLPKGSKLKLKDINIKRPGTGISPMNLKEIQGTILRRGLKEDEVITYKDIKITR